MRRFFDFGEAEAIMAEKGYKSSLDIPLQDLADLRARQSAEKLEKKHGVDIDVLRSWGRVLPVYDMEDANPYGLGYGPHVWVQDVLDWLGYETLPQEGYYRYSYATPGGRNLETYYGSYSDLHHVLEWRSNIKEVRLCGDGLLMLFEYPQLPKEEAGERLLFSSMDPFTMFLIPRHGAKRNIETSSLVTGSHPVYLVEAVRDGKWIAETKNRADKGPFPDWAGYKIGYIETGVPEPAPAASPEVNV